MAGQIHVSSKAIQVSEIPSEIDNTTARPSSTAIIWQEWTQKRAQHALMLEQVQKITKKVKFNVTQTILEERRRA